MNLITSHNIKNTVDQLELENYNKYYAMYILNSLSFARLYLETNYIHKSQKWFRKIAGNNGKNQIKIMNQLIQKKIIEVDQSYRTNIYSKSYKSNISPCDSWVKVPIKNYLNERQIKDFKARMSVDVIKVHQWHSRNIKKIIEFDWLKLSILIHEEFKVNLAPNRGSILKGTIELSIKDVVEKDSILLSDIKRKREREKEKKRRKKKKDQLTLMKYKIIDLITLNNNITKLGTKGGRHYTLLSNAPKKLRNCLVSRNTNKQFLIELDIKNSQPIFLLGMISKLGVKVEKNISEAIRTGTFYELIGQTWGYSSEDIRNNDEIRGIVKKKTYANILFANRKVRSKKTFKRFEKKFPLFAKGIGILTKNGTVSLASVLQNAEAELMLPLTKRIEGVGIHDSIIFIANDSVTEAKFIEKLVLDEFEKKYSITPELQIRVISKKCK